MVGLETEIDNIRAALVWSLSEARTVPNGMALAASLTMFWLQSGRLGEGRDWLVRLLAADDVESEARAGTLFAEAQLAIFAGGLHDAYPFLDECVTLSRALRVPYMLALALAMLGSISALRGDHAAARDAGDEATELARQLPDHSVLAQVLFWRGRIAFLLGDLPGADHSWSEGLSVLSDHGDRLLVAGFIGRLGDLAYRRNDLAMARRRCEESILVWRSVGDSAGVAQELATFGRVALAEGAVDDAARYFRESLSRSKETGSRLEIPWALSGLAMASLARGQLTRAATLFGAAAALGDSVGLPLGALYPGELDARIAELRAALGEAGFVEPWAAGRDMTFDQAFVEVLGAIEYPEELQALVR
jgi:tetratricopeptide (TPR) repeat protein